MTRICRFLDIADMPPLPPVAANRTHDLSVRSSIFAPLLSRVPAEVKQSSLYRGLRAKVLSRSAVTPPKTLTEADRTWLEQALADDIRYFSESFG